MSYNLRLFLLIILDSVIVLSAIFIASWVIEPSAQTLDPNILLITSLSLLFFHHIFASIYKLYNKVWAYASVGELLDRKSTRLNSSHVAISYAVFCLKKKNRRYRNCSRTQLIHIYI